MSRNLTHVLSAGDLQATFWPDAGMLCASLRHRGTELLRRVEDLETARTKGSTAGIPLLYPWANRLGGLKYRAGGRDVLLDGLSPRLHFDDHGLPMHGVPWSQLRWEVVSGSQDALIAGLDWKREELLAIFPFPHHVEMAVRMRPGDMQIQTTVIADRGSRVPVSFGFHPYFGLPGIPRAQWRLNAPAMRRLGLDEHGIPDGKETFSPALAETFGTTSYDNGFSLYKDQAIFSISGGGHSIAIEFQNGFPYAQIFAPADKQFVAIEPMTAATNALVSGQGLRVIEPGEQFAAAFRVVVDAAPTQERPKHRD
ncbi:MAG TPA: aldose 1-epimerase [Candidatus Eremiobacteraceae bacterium]|nr:aldose 1-epimerase [Candidatus Eremiobacteraceae bacterium]